MRWLDDITNENLMCLSRPQEFWLWTGRPGVLQSMWLQSQTLLSDWNELATEGQKKKKKKIIAIDCLMYAYLCAYSKEKQWNN